MCSTIVHCYLYRGRLHRTYPVNANRPNWHVIRRSHMRLSGEYSVLRLSGLSIPLAYPLVYRHDCNTLRLDLLYLVPRSIKGVVNSSPSPMLVSVQLVTRIAGKCIKGYCVFLPSMCIRIVSLYHASRYGSNHFYGVTYRFTRTLR